MTRTAMSLVVETREVSRVLLIEDTESDARMVKRCLQRSPYRYDVVDVSTWSAAESQLRTSHFDAVLLDLRLPDREGLELVSEALSLGRDVPMIVTTGLDDERVAIAALGLGAQDYVIKDPAALALLPRSIRFAAERQRSLRAELELKDRLLSHVSHELLTPVAAAHQLLTNLRDGIVGPLSEIQHESLAIVFRNVGQLRDMISDLMDSSRAHTGKLALDLALVSLGALAREVSQSLAATAIGKNITLAVDAVEPVSVLGDAVRLRQVATNLLANAIKFTPSGGIVSVRTGRNGPNAFMSVRDSGIGIAQEDLEQIFEHLYQVARPDAPSRRGLGLGLFIAKQIVTLHQGEISVESALDSGSTFTDEMPVFRLERLVEEPARRAAERDSQISLVRLKPRLASRVPLPADWLSRIRALAARGLYVDSDAVLPNLGCPDVHIVAVTNEEGAHAMLRRVLALIEDPKHGVQPPRIDHDIKVSTRSEGWGSAELARWIESEWGPWLPPTGERA